MDSPGHGETFDEDEPPTLRHHTKTSRLAEPKPSRTNRPIHHTPAAELANKDVEASSLPVPVPHYGPAPAYQPSSLVIKGGFLPVVYSTAVTPDSSQPTLVNFKDVLFPTINTLESFTSAEVPQPSFYPPSRPRHIQNSSVIAIVMSVLGGSFLLAAFVVAARIRSRRNGRRYLQTPSLPIPQDTFPDPQAEDSPIFGGKERFSVGITGKEKWTWTQYRSKSPLRETAKDLSDSSAKLHRSSNTLHPNEPSLKKPGFLERSLSHISALSAYSTAKSDVAELVANASAPAFASTATIADRTTANSRSSKPEGIRASLRKSKDNQAIRIIVRDWDASSEDEYVYDGVEDLPEVIAHLPAPTPNVPLTQNLGRERVKAPYPVGSCPSMNSIVAPSVTPSNSVTAPSSTDPFDDSSPYVVGPPTPKTTARKERDTQALAIALGLDSPKLGPQARTPPTRGRTSLLRRSHTFAHHTSFISIPESLSSPCPSDDGSRLGKFMLRDYRRSSLYLPREQMPPLPPPPPVAPLNVRPHANRNSILYSAMVVDDRPPRVPSPPALPSLAQMAMSRAPDYETYRSPTYSLYDVYADKDRDKRTTLFFGGKDGG